MQHKIKNSFTVLLAVAVCGLFSSCQKKFDPKSYAPVQTFGGYGTSADVAKSNLVAYFAFDNSLIDSISKTSLTNAGTSFTTGVKGNSMQVGSGHYATFVPTAAIKGLQNITIAYWVNTPINTAGIQTPVSFVNSTQFWGNLDMFFDGQTATSSVYKMHVFGSAGAKEAWLTSWSLTNPWSQWLHIALTYDMASTTFTFYVNGTAVGTSVQTGFGALNFANFPAIVFGTVQFQTTPSMTSATGSQSWASYVLGNIDQVRIYDKALPASDVKALYQLENLGK